MSSALAQAFAARPPDRFIYAFQLALALVITYALALWFDWERPKWAAFAVITIAVPHVGMSLSRAAQRIQGTLLGASVALLIIALFPQDRWLFILALSLWLSACTYMMGFSGRSYFWHCAGFIAGIIAITAANTGGNSFMLAIDRTLETSLGIVVYTMVALLVWRIRPDSDPPATTVPELFFPDTEQIIAAARVFIIYWVAFLAVVYIPDFPTGLVFLAPLGPFLMAIASTPQLPVRSLHGPVTLALLLASLLYVFVMPPLSGFPSLALLVFGFAFIAGYHFYSPQDTLARLLVLAIFSALTGISNDQGYVFAAISNNVLTFALILVLLHAASVIPERAMPGSAFRRLLDRFLANGQALAAAWRPANRLERWRLAFLRHEVKTLPAKMKAWLPRLTPMLSETEKIELDAMLQTVSACQAALLDESSDSTEQAANELAELTRRYAQLNELRMQASQL